MIDLIPDEPDPTPNATEPIQTAETEFRSQRQSEPASSTGIPDHDLDQWRAPDLDPGDGATVIELDADGAPVGRESAEPVTKDEFWLTWQIAWAAPGMLDRDFKPLEAQSGERPASDAMHDLLTIWFPGALLPGSPTIKALMVVGPVMVGKVMVAREIMAGKRASRARPVAARPTQPDAPDAGDDQSPDLAGMNGAGWFDG